jgi:hypothetical protein
VLPSYICSSSLTTIRVHVCTVHLLYIIDYNVCSYVLYRIIYGSVSRVVRVNDYTYSTCTRVRVVVYIVNNSHRDDVRVQKYGSTEVPRS